MEHADWWEFRHPQFLRGEPQLLSDIKRSVHFGEIDRSMHRLHRELGVIFLSVFVIYAAEATNVQEVSQLKHQVTDLNDRIAALHEQIDKLTGLVTHMQVKEKEEGGEYSPKLDEQAVLSSNAKSDSLKKRKLCSKKETKEPPLVRLSSCDSIMMIHEYEANGESLPSGPELNLDDRDFFGMSCDQVESGAVVKMTTVDTPLTSFGNPFLDQNNAADENDDLLNLLDEDSELYQIFSSPSPDAGHEFVDSAESPLPTANPIPACATPNPSVASPVHELSSVLESLPDELKLRFVDKLAEFMASQISRSMHGQPGYAYEVCGVHPPTHCDSSFASTYPYTVNSNDDSQHYILPSGTRAPEIALPLASAAITAMLSNITQLQHLKSVPIKEEIV